MHANYIAGEWFESADLSRNINPSDTADLIGDYCRADQAQVSMAIEAAKTAFPAWARSSPQMRADILDKIAQEIHSRRAELGNLLAREEGKALAEAVGEVTRAGYIFKYFAAECIRSAGQYLHSVRPDIEVEVTREPVGVIGILTPWNFPIAIPAWKIAPALAFGNCVVFKPADLVPGSSWALADIIARSGCPAGVFNLLMGRGTVVGEAIVNSPLVSAITFTGSTATGRRILTSGGGTRCQDPTGDGGQELTGRPRRRRPRRRRPSGPGRRLFLHRSAVHGLLPPHRPVGNPRPLRDRLDRDPQSPGRRRCAQTGHHHRTGRRSEAIRAGSGVHRHRQGRPRNSSWAASRSNGPPRDSI